MAARDTIGRYAVFTNLKNLSTFVVVICVAIGTMTTGALAVGVEVAKKCNLLTAKAFPPRVIGNPAAGSEKGTPESRQNYFNKCLANGGNMDDAARKETK
jgi:hypothetical protein